MSKQISYSLVVAGLMLAMAAGLKYAESIDVISPENARRAAQVVIGLVLAAYANVMPKDVGRLPASLRAATRSQATIRFGARALAIAGLCYSALWAFAPIAFADDAAALVVGAATVVTVGYGAWELLMCRRERKLPFDLTTEGPES